MIRATKLQKKIPIVTFDFMDWWKTDNRNMPWREETAEEERKRVERYKDVPMVVAPGQEEAYLQDMERRKAETEEQTESKPKQREKEEKEVSTSAVSAGEGMRQEQAREHRPYRPTRTAGTSWSARSDWTA